MAVSLRTSGRADFAMVYYVDESSSNLLDLSDSWRGRKLPGE